MKCSIKIVLLLFLFVPLLGCGKKDDNSSPSSDNDDDQDTERTVTEMFIYQSTATYSAQTMPSRSATSTDCMDAYTNNSGTWGITCEEAVALVGYTADNGVLNLPTSYGVPTDVPVKSIDGVTEATDWADLITTINVSMVGTGFTNIQSWTGFVNGGGVGDNCADWTSNLNADQARRSQINIAGQNWGAGGTACNLATFNLPLLCLCW
jgi:hypothetical protein